MSNLDAIDNHGTIVRNTFPLKFKEHNFGAYCFNTISCKVIYANVPHGEDEASGPTPDNYLKNLYGGHIFIKNFPPPAVASWRSLDGMAHQATVDIGAIFKDELVLHHVPQEDIPIETAAFSSVDIVLVVNNRTISVYMKTMIFLKKLRIPTNPLSNAVEQTTLAYTHTY